MPKEVKRELNQSLTQDQNYSGRELTIENRQEIDFVIATFSFFVLVIFEGSCPNWVILFAAI